MYPHVTVEMDGAMTSRGPARWPVGYITCLPDRLPDLELPTAHIFS